MPYSTHYNLPEIPSGAVEWEALYNDLVDKLEIGRTLKLTAGTTITTGTPFYIDSSAKAQICNSVTLGRGVWQSTSTNNNAEGYGQIDGTMTYVSWNWTPGISLYANDLGALSAISTAYPIGYALNTNTIVIAPVNV